MYDSLTSFRLLDRFHFHISPVSSYYPPNAQNVSWK